MKQTELVSVVISTKDRGADVMRPVRALLENDYPNFEIIIVDQSESGETAASLQPLITDTRIVYIRTTRTGISVGRNLGTRAARGRIIAMTDDDCEPSSTWVSSIAEAFASEQKIGMVFGSILAAPHDPSEGMIPACNIAEPYLATSLKERLHVEGMGACMAYRRSMWEQLKGFDESLGVGTELRSAEDSDFAVRALMAGHSIFATPGAAIVHHGFRSWQDARDLAFDYWYGTGALHAKLLRCRPIAAFSILSRLAWRWLAKASPVAASFQPLSLKWVRLQSFAKGILAGLRKPIDPTLCLFIPARTSRQAR
jgi:GT2 family glycosyltransferase